MQDGTAGPAQLRRTLPIALAARSGGPSGFEFYVVSCDPRLADKVLRQTLSGSCSDGSRADPITLTGTGRSVGGDVHRTQHPIGAGLNWYIAESLSSIVRHGTQVSHGRRSEGYELQSGTLYMHKIQLADDEVEGLRQRSENGAAGTDDRAWRGVVVLLA